MRNLVFLGDDIFRGEKGYGELLIARLLIYNPQFDIEICDNFEFVY